MPSIINIEGIGLANAQKLREAGIRSVACLLKQGRTAKGRKELADATGIEPSKLLGWVNHSDLFRIRGIGAEYADLLEAAGVDTVPELRHRNAASLYETLVKLNADRHIVRKMPNSGQVEMWIQQAKSLSRAIEY